MNEFRNDIIFILKPVAVFLGVLVMIVFFLSPIIAILYSIGLLISHNYLYGVPSLIASLVLGMCMVRIARKTEEGS